MTKRDFLRSELLKALNIKLKPYGFRLNKILAEFSKKNKDGWYKYQIIFLLTDKGWEINPCLLIRLDIIENIFHKTSGFEEKFKRGTPTIGTSVEDYLKTNQTHRYILSEESQINQITEELYFLFQTVALPFFEKYNSIEKIETILNENPEDISLTGPIFKGSKALILAKLLDRKNYNELKEKYLRYYTSFSNGFYLPEYQKLIISLED